MTSLNDVIKSTGISNLQGSIELTNLHHTNSLIGYLHHKFELYSNEEVIQTLKNVITEPIYFTGITLDFLFPLSKRIIFKSFTTESDEVEQAAVDILHALIELYIRRNGLGKQYAAHVGKKNEDYRPTHRIKESATIATLNAAHSIKSTKSTKVKKESSMAWLYSRS